MNQFSKRLCRVAVCVATVAVCSHAANAHAGSATFDSSSLSHNMELVFDQVIHAFKNVVTQGPGALIDLMKQWAFTLANAITNPQSN